jgi:hypothetical protein
MKREFTLAIGAGMLGLFTGVLLPEPWPAAERRLQDETRPLPASRTRGQSSTDAGEAGGPRRHKSLIRPHRDDSGKAGMSGDDQARVPLALLRDLGAASGNRIVADRLFNDSSAERMLGVTDLEKARLQPEWEKALDALKTAEVAAMRYKEAGDGTVKIVLPPAPADFRAVGQCFRREVLGVMGAERGEAFLALKQVDSHFHPVEGEQSCEVRSEPTGNGAWNFHLTLDGPDGRRVWVSETIPDEISHLTDAAGIRRTLSE